MKSVSNCANSTKPKISQSNDEKIREAPDPNTDNINRNAILIAIIQNPGIRYRELMELIIVSIQKNECDKCFLYRLTSGRVIEYALSNYDVKAT